MSEEMIKNAADAAELIVDGYAFLPDASRIKIVHLYTGRVAVVDSTQGVVKPDGATDVAERGTLSDCDVSRIQNFIKLHYRDMYRSWSELSDNGFYIGR